MFEEIHRFVVQRTAGKRMCTVDEIYEHFSLHTETSDHPNGLYKIDEYTWPFFLKAYIADPDVKVTSQENSESNTKEALLQICEENTKKNHKTRSASQFRFDTKAFAVSHTKAFLEKFLLFGGRAVSEEVVPLTHLIYAAGPSGVRTAALAEELEFPIQRVLYLFQGYISTLSIAIMVRNSFGSNLIHLKWMYHTAPFSLGLRGMNHLGDQSVRVKTENETEVEANTTLTIHKEKFEPLRCDNGSRVWNSDFFRQTHVKHSIVHQIVSLYANFPNTPVVMKASRFFVATPKEPKITQMVYDVLQPFVTKFFSYKNMLQANLVHVPHHSMREHACRVVDRRSDDDASTITTKSKSRHAVEIVDVDLDAMPSNMQVRILHHVSPDTLVNAQGECFPIQRTTSYKWVVNEVEPEINTEVKQSLKSNFGTSIHLHHEKSFVTESHVVKISRMNGYRLRLVDRAQILHEYMTRIVFERFSPGSVKDKFVSTEETRGEQENDAYERFLRLHSSQSNTNVHSVCLELRSILDEMPLGVFCALFKGKWDFSEVLQNKMPLGIDELSNVPGQQITLRDAIRFALPKGLRTVRLGAAPELRAATSTRWGVYAQMFLMLRFLHGLKLIHTMDWKNSTPQRSSRFLYRFPICMHTSESENDDASLLKYSLAELWNGVRANWTMRSHMRPLKRLDPVFRTAAPVNNTQKKQKLRKARDLAINSYRQGLRTSRKLQFSTVPWWFNASYAKAVKQDILATSHFQNSVSSVLPEVEKLFRKGSLIDSEDIVHFFSSLDALSENDPLSSLGEEATETAPSGAPVAARSALKKHYPSELVLFAIFITRTVRGRKLTSVLESILPFEDDSKKIDHFRLRSENEMHLTYLQSVLHAALVFYDNRGVPSIDLPLCIIKSIVFGILELFHCGGVTQRVTEECSTDEIIHFISLRDLCGELQDAHFKEFISSARCSLGETLDDGTHVSHPVDWTGIPPTWEVSALRSHRKFRSLAINDNIKFYESTYLSPRQTASRQNTRGETTEPSALVEISNCLLNPWTNDTSIEDASTILAVRKSAERMQWVTKSLFSEIELRIQSIEPSEGEEIAKLYLQMSLRNGYEETLRSETIYPRIDREDVLIVAPEVTESEKTAHSEYQPPSHLEYHELLWKTINEHFDEIVTCSKAQPTVVHSEQIHSTNTEIPADNTTETNDRELKDRAKAEIVAYLIHCPGSEETAVYEAIASSCAVNIALYRNILEEMTKDGVLEVECYRARSSRGQNGSLYPLWLRAYSLAM